MNNHSAVRRSLIALLLPLAIWSCIDSPTEPSIPEGFARLQFRANVVATSVRTLVVEVTAPDITDPPVFNIEAHDGVASGQVTVPAGSDRTITVRAYDSGGIETHRGSSTLDVKEGTNATVLITLLPLMGTQPISVSIGSIVIAVSPGVDTLLVGDTIRLRATIIGPSSDTISGKVTWATLNPARARVDTTGLVTALDTGRVHIVGTYAGVGGASVIFVRQSSSGGEGGYQGGDTTAPTIGAFSFTPDSVDVSLGSASVSATFSVADVGSGVDYVRVYFYGPSGQQYQGCYGSLVSGTKANGTWKCTVTIPQYSEAGQWRVSDLILTDEIGNSRTLNQADLFDAGYAGWLIVASSAADTTAPTLSAFSFTPDSVDVSLGSASVSATFSVADVGSGVDYVRVYFYGPSGQQYQGCYSSLVSGTKASGTWTCTVTIPRYSEAGEWRVSDLILTDEIGNSRTLNQADILDAGFAGWLTVVN